jgi:hypothetical protein
VGGTFSSVAFVAGSARARCFRVCDAGEWIALDTAPLEFIILIVFVIFSSSAVVKDTRLSCHSV